MDTHTLVQLDLIIRDWCCTEQLYNEYTQESTNDTYIEDIQKEALYRVVLTEYQVM